MEERTTRTMKMSFGLCTCPWCGRVEDVACMHSASSNDCTCWCPCGLVFAYRDRDRYTTSLFDWDEPDEENALL